MSHTQSSMRNLIAALVGQICGVLISFIARMIFLQYLSAEYLGLNGLFTNILSIFSLVELGVGPAMNFSMYKPLAHKDTEKVKSLMRLYKKAYILIGCAIALLGLIFTPFYTIFMDEVPNIPNLTLIYWLFTANTVVSYFFSYKRALIICDEKRYIATIFRYAFYFLLNIAQIVVLIVTHNYILFLVLQVLFTFAENVGVSKKADQMYPYLKDKDVAPLPREDKNKIGKNIGAMIFHKIGGMVVFSSDNLILSKYVGLVSVGLYSNYYLITDGLNKVLSQFFTSLTASVGTLNASDKEADHIRLEKTFDRVFFANFWIYGFSTCCLWVLFNPFISLWLGSDMLFDRFTVLIIVINFFLTGMRKAVLTFWEATATFYYDRFKPIFEVTINLVTSIILAKSLGTAGVFLGTIISTLSTCIWIEPYVLYKNVFKKSARGYAWSFVKYTGITVLATAAASFLADLVPVSNLFFSFIIKIVICLIVPNLIFMLIFLRDDKFIFFLELMKKALLSVRRLLQAKRS